MLEGLKAAALRLVGRPVLRWLGSWEKGGALVLDREVGDPRSNSAVEAVIGWIARNFPEAPIEVLQVDGEELTAIPLHPMVRLIEKPNPYYSGQLLWLMTILSKLATGNAYWRKIRNENGVPVELWWIPNPWLKPIWPKDGSAYLSHYEYRPDPNAPKEIVPVDDIVHFREGIDPDNYRLGRSRLYSLLREIYTDNEAARYTAAILRNLGVPGLIVAPKTPDTQVDAVEIERVVDERFTGQNRGRTMTLTAPADVTIVGFSPDKMNLRDLRRIPEERISGVYGVAAIVAGLGAGLDRSTFANFAEARQAAYEECCIPMQRDTSAELEVQLLPDFHTTAQLEKLDVAFDVSKVRVLADDADALVKRVDLAVSHGWLSVAAGKRLVGFQVEQGDEVYLRSWNLVASPVGVVTTQPVVTQRQFGPSSLGSGLASLAGLKAGVNPLKDRLQKLVGKRLASELADFFSQLRERITAAGAGKADWDAAIDWEQESRALHDILVKAYGQVGEEVYQQFQAETGLELPTQTTDLTGVLGSRVTGIVDETRRELAELVSKAQAAGYTQAQLLDGVPEDGFLGLRPAMAGWSDLAGSSEARAELIARTELGTAYNLSSTGAYRDSGVVQFVTVFDGDGDQECSDAHGATWTLDRADREPLGHPNCQRAFAPVFPAPQLASLGNGNGHKSAPIPLTGNDGWTLIPPAVSLPAPEVKIDSQPWADALEDVEANHAILSSQLKDAVQTLNAPRQHVVIRDERGLMIRVDDLPSEKET